MMRIKYSLITVFLLLICITNYHSQAKIQSCSLKIDDAPKLRGFYLGQSSKDVFERLPDLEEKFINSANFEDNKAIGYAEVYAFSDAYDEALKEINIDLRFLDGKLYFISVGYEKYEPDNLQMFMKQVSETTQLPLGSWKLQTKYSAEIICHDFSAWIWTGREEARSYYQAYPSFRLIDLTANNLKEKREKELRQQELNRQRELKRIETEKKLEEQRRRKVFKP